MHTESHTWEENLAPCERFFTGKSGAIFFHTRIRGRRIELSTKQRSLDVAYRILPDIRRRAKLKAYVSKRCAERRIGFRCPTWESEVDACRSTKEHWLGYIYRRAKDRARRRHKAFSLTYDQLCEIALKSGGVCQFSGMHFSYEKQPGWSVAPFAPSLDRIRSAGGYTPGNCRLVCNCINAALGEWGDDVLMRVLSELRCVTAP